MKTIVITGGVTSGVGKATTLGATGYLLQRSGVPVTPIKFDGLFNPSMRSMNPGSGVLWTGEEVFMLANGHEVDSDLGVYERFLDIELTRANSILNADVWRSFLDSDAGPGVALKIRPHLLDAYESFLNEPANPDTVRFVEVGGTIGDDENGFMLETIRRMKIRGDAVVHIHQTLVPGVSNEDDHTSIDSDVMLKPAKQSVRQTVAYGLPPDIVILRSTYPIGTNLKNRLSADSSIPSERYFSAPDVRSPYALADRFRTQGLDDVLLTLLRETNRHTDRTYLDGYEPHEASRTIAILGDSDSWGSLKSLTDALHHTSHKTGQGLTVIHASDPSRIPQAAGYVFTEDQSPDRWSNVSSAINEHSLPSIYLGTAAKLLIGSEGPNLTKRGAYEVTTTRGPRTDRFLIDTTLADPDEREFTPTARLEDRIVEGYRTRNPNVMFAASRPEFTSRPSAPHPTIVAFLERCM